MAVAPQGFPKITTEFVVPGTGRINQEWYRFMLSLWDRTGGASGETNPGGFVSGDIKAIAYATAPSGWIVCDGSVISRTTYASLFAAIGTTWGAGDGSSTFGIPDLRGRMLLGSGSSYVLGALGGASSVTLSTANLPPHNHSVIDPGHTHVVTDPGHAHAITDPTHAHTITDAGHFHNITDPTHAHTVPQGGVGVTSPVNAGNGSGGAVTTSSSSTGITINTAATGIVINSSATGITVNSNTTGATVNSAVTGITTGNTGSGTAFSTISPYAVITWVIKT